MRRKMKRTTMRMTMMSNLSSPIPFALFGGKNEENIFVSKRKTIIKIERSPLHLDLGNEERKEIERGRRR